MKIKRYTGTSSREILQRMRRELGSEAVILSNREIVGGVEIVAAIDFEEVKSVVGRAPIAAARAPAAPAAKPAPVAQGALQQRPSAAAAATAREAAPMHKEMARLFSEMADLRRLLQAGTGAPAVHAQQAAFLDAGFSATFAQACAQEFPAQDSPAALQSYLRAHLPVAADPLATGGAFAFIGPTGVGKTTTIAKLAARQVLRHGADAVALITLDTYRIGGVEQLKIYGRILGVPVVVARGAEELSRHLAAFSGRRHVFIDSIGLSPRDERLKEQLEWLRGLDRQVGNVLVMTSGMTRSFYHALSRLYHELTMAGCIITKLDESSAPGAVLEWLVERSLPLWFCTDGQGVPEDIHAPDPAYLMKFFRDFGEGAEGGQIYPFSSAPVAPLAMQGI